jgi:hypothetical protein
LDVNEKNISKVTDIIRNIQRSDRFSVVENALKLQKEVIANSINKELITNLIDKKEYKNLEYGRYTVLDKHYLQTKRIEETQTQLGVKDIYEARVTEDRKSRIKKSTIKQTEKKPTKLERQINLVSKIINKTVMSEILSGKKAISFEDIKRSVIRDYKTEVNRLKKKKIETQVRNTYEEQINKLDSINKRITVTDKFLARINRIKNTVDTIFKLSGNTRLLNFFVKNRKLKVDDVKNMLSKRYYSDQERIYRKNIKSEVKEFFKEKFAKTYDISRLAVNRSFTEKIAKTKMREFNTIADKTKKIETTVRGVEKRNIILKSRIDEKIGKKKTISTDTTDTNVLNRYSDTLEFVNRNVKKQGKKTEKVLNIKKLAEFFVNRKVSDHIQKNILGTSKTVETDVLKTYIDKNLIHGLEKKSVILKDGTYVDFLNKKTSIGKKIKNITNVKNETVLGEKISDIRETRSNIKKIHKRDISRRDVSTETRVLHKNISLFDNKLINERVKQATQRVVNSVLNAKFIEDKAAEVPGETSKIETFKNIRKDVPLTVKESISQMYSTECLVPRRKMRILSPRIKVSKTIRHEEKDFYRDVEQGRRTYYNDMIEEIGREHLIRERKILEDERFHSDVTKGDMVYKKPILLDQFTKDKGKKESGKTQKEPEPTIVTKKITRNKRNIDDDFSQTNNLKNQKKEKILSENDIINLIQTYMKGVNIDAISRNVIGKLEQRTRIDRKRQGIF